MLCRRCVRLSAIWLVSAFMSHLLLRLFRVITDMSGFMECSVHRGVSDLCVFYLCLSRTFVSRFVVTSLVSRFAYLRRICSRSQLLVTLTRLLDSMVSASLALIVLTHPPPLEPPTDPRNRCLLTLHVIMFLCDPFLPSFASRGAPSHSSTESNHRPGRVGAVFRRTRFEKSV